jgi:hypothetical protein
MRSTLFFQVLSQNFWVKLNSSIPLTHIQSISKPYLPSKLIQNLPSHLSHYQYSDASLQTPCQDCPRASYLVFLHLPLPYSPLSIPNILAKVILSKQKSYHLTPLLKTLQWLLHFRVKSKGLQSLYSLHDSLLSPHALLCLYLSSLSPPVTRYTSSCSQTLQVHSCLKAPWHLFPFAGRLFSQIICVTVTNTVLSHLLQSSSDIISLMRSTLIKLLKVVTCDPFLCSIFPLMAPLIYSH